MTALMDSGHSVKDSSESVLYISCSEWRVICLWIRVHCSCVLMLLHAAHENNSLENLVFLPHWHKLKDYSEGIRNQHQKWSLCLLEKSVFTLLLCWSVSVRWLVTFVEETYTPALTDKHKVMTQASLDPVGLHVLISLRCGGHCVVLG